MGITVRTASEVVEIDCALPWLDELIREALHGAYGMGGMQRPTMRLEIERSRDAFPIDQWPSLTRGTWHRNGDLVMRDVCTSGFDLLARPGPVPTFVFRWRPPPRTRAAATALRSRHVLLVRAALLQYPALWFAGRRGVTPLHAPCCTSGDSTVMLAGPAGVGKTTLIAAALAGGSRANGDNLAAADGVRSWGVVEPQRVEGAPGPRMPHGRGEHALPNRIDVAEPDHLFVLRRGDPAQPVSVRPCPPEVAARCLVTGTYMAGELRRFWPFAATMAAATGIGPAHPPVGEVAARFAERITCVEVSLPRVAGIHLRDLVAAATAVRSWPASHPSIPARTSRPIAIS